MDPDILTLMASIYGEGGRKMESGRGIGGKSPRGSDGQRKADKEMMAGEKEIASITGGSDMARNSEEGESEEEREQEREEHHRMENPDPGGGGSSGRS